MKMLLAPPDLPLGPGSARPGQPTVEIGYEPSWVSGPDGTRYRLAEAYGRIIAAFLDLHGRAPEAVLTTDDLLAAGWPNERPLAASGANRVYVALAHLRRMGLRHVIERCGNGYRFAPAAVIKR
jgi:hypothetical protein